MQNPLQETGTQESLKMISKQIKTRLERAGKRFYAADNIAEFMYDGEKEQLIDEVAAKFETVIDSLVIDRDNDPNSQDTGRRMAKMYVNEIMSGRYDTSSANTMVADTMWRQEILLHPTTIIIRFANRKK